MTPRRELFSIRLLYLYINGSSPKVGDDILQELLLVKERSTPAGKARDSRPRGSVATRRLEPDPRKALTRFGIYREVNSTSVLV